MALYTREERIGNAMRAAQFYAEQMQERAGYVLKFLRDLEQEMASQQDKPRKRKGARRGA